MKAPGFWYGRPGAAAALLSPAALAFDAAGRARRAFAEPYRAGIPVVCIGNLVAGGAGKTPVALAVAQALRDRGIDAHFLSRGHGGRLAGPLRVDPAVHDADAVGDEPLLLAESAPAWIARDRAAGARAAAAAGAGAIVMDDGHQNPSLAKDLSLLVVDGATGFGNGRVIPAGPLRETPDAGLARADAVVTMGEDRRGVAALAAARSLPVLRARLAPEAAGWLAGATVVAFAGIARPEKFFETLRALGARLAATFAYGDHHRFRPAEIARMQQAAEAAGALLVTTAKDHVRLPEAARPLVRVLAVRVAWDDPAALARLLDPVVSHGG